MNIILFDVGEVSRPLPLDDTRARHLLEVLRRRPGESFEAGLIDGPRGRGTLLAIDEGSLRLSFAWSDDAPPPLDPVTLLVGLPRPQTSRRLLQDATAMGVCALHFVAARRGEASYAQSPLWQTQEWRRHVIAGAQQAVSTRLPAVSWQRSLAEVIEGLPPAGARLALDNYEASSSLADAPAVAPVTLAIGPERGWADSEREALRRGGFELVHLGPRVLRVETAAVAALALVKAKLGLL